MADTVVETDAVDSRDREDFWHHVLSDTFAPIHLDGWAAPSEPFASLGSTQRGRLLFVEHEATAQVHRRTPHLIRGSDFAFFQLAVITKGSGSLRQEDRVATLAPGDLVVYENSRPFSWTFPGPWSAIGLCIPSDAIRLSEPERRHMSARRLPGRSGLSGVVSRFVRDIARHASDLSELQSERVLAQASDLAISLLADPTNPDYADARYRSILERVKGHVEMHLRDPALTPDRIAAAANISARYLHKIFESEHETVALYLRGRRLEVARDELLDPRTAGRSIAAIAHGCGFGDISGFTRAFKAAYGVTPSEIRKSRYRQTDPTPTDTRRPDSAGT